MDSLGKTLKNAREIIPLTLRQVEEASGISNAYLSQLENDKIKKPSANVLYKLAALYNVPLENLLGAAGIIPDFKPTEINFFAQTKVLAAENITQEEEAELLKYLRYIRYQNSK